MSDENEAGVDDGTTETPAQNPELEDKARKLGWVPEDEWRGSTPPPAGFLTAEAFLEQTFEKIGGIRRHNKELTRELGSLRSELGEIKASAEAFRAFSEKALAKERAEKEAYVQQLENRRAQAISEGDGNTAVAAERAIAATKEELARSTTQAPNPQVQAVLNQWAMANPWYQADEQKRAWADGRALQLRSQGLQGVELLDRLSKDVVKAFPEDSQGGNRPGGIEGKGRRSPESFGKRGFDDLPEEAKKAYETFRKSVPNLTKRQYLEQYQWDA